MNEYIITVITIISYRVFSDDVRELSRDCNVEAVRCQRAANAKQNSEFGTLRYI